MVVSPRRIASRTGAQPRAAQVRAEVEQRPLGRRDRDAEVGRRRPREDAAVVHEHPAVPPRPARARADHGLEGAVGHPAGPQPPGGAGADVAQPRTRRGQRRRHPPPARIGEDGRDGVDALLDDDQAAGGDAVLYGPRREAEREQLAPGDAVVLASGDSSESSVPHAPSRWGTTHVRPPARG